VELRRLRILPRRAGLSGRLLLLTIAFVMLTEVLLFAPSIARYRLVYLEQKLAAAHLAGLSLEATPDRMVTAQLTSTLLRHVGAYAAGLYGEGKLTHNLMVPEMPAVDREIDLRDDTAIELVRDAFDTLIQRRNRILRAIGESPKDASVLAVVVLDEQPLQEEMFGYSKRILGLSIVIALATASALDRKSTRLNSSHNPASRMPSSA
jgi:hypothetical protein